MRIVAILASYNEERFIAGCLDHLFEQGVEAYLIDNCSTDRTVEIAERYLGRGLIGIETFPREEGIFRLGAQLRRKEELAAALEAEWFMHADIDEIRLPPRSDRTLALALTEVDEQGYNAVNFLEFTFVPTKEAPDHDHLHFQQTMKWYYPFLRNFPQQVKAWKRQPKRVDLGSSGHRVKFEDLRLYPESFKMRHYQFLSVPHFINKYVDRQFDPQERGHGWRIRLVREKIQLPSQAELHTYTSDDELDLTNPRTLHIAEDWALPSRERRRSAGPRDKIPIILGGYHCSGISLVGRMLDAHSRIYCGPEVKFFRDFHNDYLEDPIRHQRFMTSAHGMLPKPQLLKVLGKAFVALHGRAAARVGKPRWADKNPENVVYLREWQKLLGDDWVFVHVVRNPLDTLASIKEVELPLVMPPELGERITLYKRYAQAGLDFGELYPERYCRVVYERLLEYPELVISELMHWLGEDFEPTQLGFNSLDYQGELGDQNVRHTAEVHTESVGRWKELLTPSEAELISQECDPLWQQVSSVDIDEARSSPS
jgi:hypothetical protein